jgi:O-antigen/teichoic acid export membrane protein
MVSQFATQGIAFIVAPLYARALTPEEYGTISLANSIRAISMVLMPLGAAAGVSYWYNLHRSEPSQARHAVGAIAGLALVCSTAWLIVGLLSGAWIQARFLPDFPLPFWPYGGLILGAAWLLGLVSVPSDYLSVRERQDRNAYLSIGNGILQVGFLVAFVVVLHRGAGGQVEATFLYALISGAFYFWLLQRETPLRVDKKLWRDMFRYGLPIVPHVLAVWGLNMADRLIIGHYGVAYAHDLGLYSFGYTIAQIMLIVNAALSTIWSAVYMEQARSNPQATKSLGRAASWCALGLALAAAGLILGAPVLIAIIGSSRYAGSERFVAPVVVAYLMQGFYLLPTMAFFHVKKTHWIFMITLPAVIVNVTLNLIFIPRYGVIVASWTTLIGFTIMAVLGFLRGHRLFPLQYLRLPLLLAALTVATAWLGANWLPGGLAGTAGKAGLWLALTGMAWAAWYWLESRRSHERAGILREPPNCE